MFVCSLPRVIGTCGTGLEKSQHIHKVTYIYIPNTSLPYEILMKWTYHKENDMTHHHRATIWQTLSQTYDTTYAVKYRGKKSFAANNDVFSPCPYGRKILIFESAFKWAAPLTTRARTIHNIINIMQLHCEANCVMYCMGWCTVSQFQCAEPSTQI